MAKGDSPDATRRLFRYLREGVEAIDKRDKNEIALVETKLGGILDLDIREPRHVTLAKKAIRRLALARQALG